MHCFSTSQHATCWADMLSEDNRHRTSTILKNTQWGLMPSKSEKYNRAAVLVPLCTVNGVPSVLFTQRSLQLKRNRGQISFPGGKSDGTDRDDIHTALREAWEEIGLVPRSVDVWTTMSSAIDRYKMLVTPVVGNCGEVQLNSLKLNESEVVNVFALSLEYLCNPAASGYTLFCSKHSYSLPVWHHHHLNMDTHQVGKCERIHPLDDSTYFSIDKTQNPCQVQVPRIWGWTALILHHVLRAMAQEHYSLRPRQPTKKKTAVLKR